MSQMTGIGRAKTKLFYYMRKVNELSTGELSTVFKRFHRRSRRFGTIRVKKREKAFSHRFLVYKSQCGERMYRSKSIDRMSKDKKFEVQKKISDNLNELNERMANSGSIHSRWEEDAVTRESRPHRDARHGRTVG
jgi:hypothetical protein